MNFDDAIAAHVKWKVRLTQFIDGTGPVLVVDVVSNDTLCDLGKWLYGEGEHLKPLRAFRQLVDKHAEFHICAAAIVERAELGDMIGARAILAGIFANISNEMTAAVLEFKKAAAAV